jgi:hypothetical protein
VTEWPITVTATDEFDRLGAEGIEGSTGQEPTRPIKRQSQVRHSRCSPTATTPTVRHLDVQLRRGRRVEHLPTLRVAKCDS